MTGLSTTAYRYCLEMRSRLVWLAAIAVYLGASSADWAKSVPVAPELLATDLALSIDRQSLLDWIAFSAQMSFFAWTAAFCLMGGCLRKPWSKRDGSVSYI